MADIADRYCPHLRIQSAGMNTTTDARIDWNAELRSQLEWHWTNQLRPRLAGLTDEEYFWEPVSGCWNIRPRGESTAPIAVGGGHTR